MNLTALENLQSRLAAKVIIPPDRQGYFPAEDDLIFSLDIQYEQDKAYIALDVQKWHGEKKGIYAAASRPEMEYVPQFFCFREGPLLMKMIHLVRSMFGLQPALLIIDGHGMAHPRRFGVACWLGVETGLPAIGCAKETLLRYEGTLDAQRGAQLPVVLEKETVGAVLRTQENIKPVFVSPGHRVSLDNACEIMLKLSPEYRISEPLRRADQVARLAAKGQITKEFMWLGEIR